MNIPRCSTVHSVVAIACSFMVPQAGALAQSGGGSLGSSVCVDAAERALVASSIADFQTQGGTLSSPGGVAPDKFTFYPMSGNLYGDLYTTNFVDLDASSGLLDWDCTDHTYNGHDASDTIIRSFGEQAIGVPIFAALDGTVISIHDGEFDMNTTCSGVGNHVIIDHGAGRICRYWHFKQGSVQVSVGQFVRAGEQLGLTGSSGCSTWPHLHFSTHDSNVLVEPYAGPCRPGPSEWTDQTPIRRDFYMIDLNVSDADLSSQPGLPFDMPRAGTFLTGQQQIGLWVILGNLPANSTRNIRLYRPDGTLGYNMGNTGFNNPVIFRGSWWWWNFSVNLNMVGTWTLRFSVNGQIAQEVPVEVVAAAGSIVNRPPYPVGAQIEPAFPNTGDVLICRTDTDLVLDDPDFDIVRFRYVWEIAGNVVRDVTTAAHSDVLQRNLAGPGDLVTCTVTPSDGSASAASVQDSVAVCGSVVTCIPNPNNVADISTDSCSCSSDSIRITMTGAAPNQPGYLLVGAGTGSIHNPPGAVGGICLAGAPIGRYVADIGMTDATGLLETDILNATTGGGNGNLPSPPGGNVCTPAGQTWRFQYWYRDGANPSRFSKALSVTFN